jgi:hypothetical protein
MNPFEVISASTPEVMNFVKNKIKPVKLQKLLETELNNNFNIYSFSDPVLNSGIIIEEKIRELAKQIINKGTK